jgi:hypothetical protein
LEAALEMTMGTGSREEAGEAGGLGEQRRDASAATRHSPSKQDPKESVGKEARVTDEGRAANTSGL